MKKIILFVLTFVLIMPNILWATEQVSLKFDEEDSLVYFPMKERSGFILSNQSFYSSAQLNNKKSWEEENFTYARNDQLDSTVSDNVVSFRNYNYVIINAGEATENDFLTTNTEIWRLKKENPQQFKQVLQKESNESNYFVKLAKFKNKLYTITQNGSVYKTNNGINWIVLASPSLPANTNVTDLVVSEKKLYLVANNITYSSINGQVWKRIKGDYRNENAQKAVVYNNQLYIYTINDNNKSSLWLKNNNEWEKILSGQKEMYLLKHINNKLYIIKNTTKNEQEASYSVLESEDGLTFEKIYSGHGLATQMYKNKDDLVLITSNNEKIFLLKL